MQNKYHVTVELGNGGFLHFGAEVVSEEVVSTLTSPYLQKEVILKTITKQYNPNYGDNKLCTCGHPYYRHFDSYEGMAPVGCKYCGCEEFTPVEESPSFGEPEPKFKIGQRIRGICSKNPEFLITDITYSRSAQKWYYKVHDVSKFPENGNYSVEVVEAERVYELVGDK